MRSMSSLYSRLAKGVCFDGAARPVQQQQSLEVIIAADVVAAAGSKHILASPVRMTGNDERDPLRVGREKFFEGGVARKSVPQKTIPAMRRSVTREVEAVESGMVSQHERLPCTAESLVEMPLELGDHELREPD